MLQADYRSPIEITDTTMSQAEAALERLDAFARRTSDLTGAPSAEVLEQFRAAMDDDMNHEARAARDFARADELRDELAAAGWTVEDSAEGPVLRKA